MKRQGKGERTHLLSPLKVSAASKASIRSSSLAFGWRKRQESESARPRDGRWTRLESHRDSTHRHGQLQLQKLARAFTPGLALLALGHVGEVSLELNGRERAKRVRKRSNEAAISSVELLVESKRERE